MISASRRMKLTNDIKKRINVEQTQIWQVWFEATYCTCSILQSKFCFKDKALLPSHVKQDTTQKCVWVCCTDNNFVDREVFDEWRAQAPPAYIGIEIKPIIDTLQPIYGQRITLKCHSYPAPSITQTTRTWRQTFTQSSPQNPRRLWCLLKLLAKQSFFWFNGACVLCFNTDQGNRIVLHSHYRIQWNLKHYSWHRGAKLNKFFWNYIKWVEIKSL